MDSNIPESSPRGLRVCRNSPWTGLHGFTIDRKWRGGFKPKDVLREDPGEILKDCLKRLIMDSVDIYIHSPPPAEEMKSDLASVNEAYKSDLFKRFGMSNFKAGDVQKIHEFCESRGFVKPSVYQRDYNPVARNQETVLFLNLRKLGMAFFAYSPSAGGFLTETEQDIADGKGRFDKSTLVG